MRRLDAQASGASHVKPSVRAADLLSRHLGLHSLCEAPRALPGAARRILVMIDANEPIKGLVGKLLRRQDAKILHGSEATAPRRSGLYRDRDVRCVKGFVVALDQIATRRKVG